MHIYPARPLYAVFALRGNRMSQTLCKPFRRIIIVSYRLPFKVLVIDGGKKIEQSSGGLVSSILALSEKMRGQAAEAIYENVIWVGKAENTQEEYDYLNQSIDGFDLVPVSLPKKINDKYYNGFCNDLIWPLFHYFPSLVVFDENYYENYTTANKLFADKLKEIVRPDDFIWIHDYQLFLLPAMARDEFPFANIGFFLHIPFPAFEMFRILPRRWREGILHGILGADVVGFHTFDYSQYFLRTVSRLLGYEITMDTVSLEDRVVKVGAFPLGIDYEKFNDAATNNAEIKEERIKILSTLKNQKVIFSIDRLDYSKGLIHRLEAFEYFLETYPEWIEKIVYNMVVIPSREHIFHYQDMKREIDATVGRINAKYSTIAWRPIIYQYKSLPFKELIALYDLSSVGLITPIRDGMNLVAKEYIASQVNEIGVLILSEMAGAASELGEALLINPTDKREVADALNRALTMRVRERTILLRRMQKRIKQYTVFSWAQDFFDSMIAIKKVQEKRKVNIVTPLIESEIVKTFSNAGRRVIFIDYDGTLVPYSRIPELAVPEPATIDQLRRLSGNPKTTVVLINGRDKNFLEDWFASVNIHLIAEHGAFHKAPHDEWQRTIDSDQSWKMAIAPVLQRYIDKCKGSFVEDKFSSLAWHYRNSPTDIGSTRAKELIEELRALVSHENKLQVLEGSKVIEIKRTGYDKGIAALNFIGNTEFDCIIAIGDDRTDEDIFRSLPPSAITIKIGIRTSMAKYNLKNQREVEHLIERLIERDRDGR